MWSARYFAALDRYQKVDVHSPEAVQAVAQGLLEWAALLPARGRNADGRPAPANWWGLGAEQSVIRGLCSYLVAARSTELAGRLSSEMDDLLETATRLDEQCGAATRDTEAEKRLAGTAGIQAKALAELLGKITVRRPAAGPSSNSRTATAHLPKPRRGAPRRSNPDDDAKLVASWKQVRGNSSMTRKEFCAERGIKLRMLIRAQDRVRKNASLTPDVGPTAPDSTSE